MSAGTPKAVVFDVGRVLVQWDIRALFRKLIPDPQQLDWFLANVVTEEWHFQHDAGRSLDDMLPERLARFPEHSDLLTAYRERFLETIPGRVAGTDQLVERLAAKNIPLFAITNFGEEFWDMFRPTEPLLDHFKDIVVSGREKCAKPSAQIFELAQQRFGFAPPDMLFIDDNAVNIDSARSLGWQVHHFHDAAMLESDLTKRGLLG